MLILRVMSKIQVILAQTLCAHSYIIYQIVGVPCFHVSMLLSASELVVLFELVQVASLDQWLPTYVLVFFISSLLLLLSPLGERHICTSGHLLHHFGHP